MMMDKRLIGTVSESKKYIAGNVICQWISLVANIVMMFSITQLLAELFQKTADRKIFIITALTAVIAAIIRFVCAVLSAKMGYLSSKAVKKRLREKIYQKLLHLGSSYKEQVQTSEVVQVAVEGVDQLETYFGAYLPQFFYAMLAPLTLFAVLCFVNVPSAIVLLVCVPMIPVAIAAVQTWAKKLLSKYWGQYTALGDTFLENLQGLTTLKIYQADEFKNGEMNADALARALLHDSPVYIFDEATSNIDVESENDIMNEILSLTKTKTVILISHRLANVVKADTIYVMTKGQVAESGSHKELLRNGAAYEKLWTAQQNLENYGKEGAAV